jgi:hypothetical protein
VGGDKAEVGISGSAGKEEVEPVKEKKMKKPKKSHRAPEAPVEVKGDDVVDGEAVAAGEGAESVVPEDGNTDPFADAALSDQAKKGE